MKKLLSIILILIMVLSLFGCKSRGNTDDEEIATVPADDVEEDVGANQDSLQQENEEPKTEDKEPDTEKEEPKTEKKDPVTEEKEPVTEEKEPVQDAVGEVSTGDDSLQQDTQENTTETYTEPPENAEELKILPKLSVLTQEGLAELRIANYNFTYKNEDGQNVTVKREGISPLMHKDDLPVIEFTRPGMHSLSISAPELGEDVYSADYTGRCWSEDCFGKPDAESQKVDFMVLSDHSPDGCSKSSYVYPKQQNMVYEITAEWNYSDNISGTVTYCFYGLYAEEK